MVRRHLRDEACKALTCEHPRCAHGRPHCPVCPAPGRTRRSGTKLCAACSIEPALYEDTVCKACKDRGVEAPALFDV